MKMEKNLFKLDLYPDYMVSIALLKNVDNVPIIRQKLLKGELGCALLNTDLIPDVLPVLLACNKAMYNVTNSCMKTRNLHSEILYNMSPSNGITGSLKTFGVTNSHTSFLCVCIRKDGETDGVEHVLKMADGAIECSLKELQELHDSVKIKKLYKIGDDEISLDGLSNAIVMRISTKEAM